MHLRFLDWVRNFLAFSISALSLFKSSPSKAGKLGSFNPVNTADWKETLPYNANTFSQLEQSTYIFIRASFLYQAVSCQMSIGVSLASVESATCCVRQPLQEIICLFAATQLVVTSILQCWAAMRIKSRAQPALLVKHVSLHFSLCFGSFLPRALKFQTPSPPRKMLPKEPGTSSWRWIRVTYS